MTLQRISKEEYLDKSFDYSKLTKQELRQIMSENDIEDIPNLTSLKSVILESYKANIYDRIDELKGKFSADNVFQGERQKTSGNASFTEGDKKKVNANASFQSEGQKGYANSSFQRNGANASFLEDSVFGEEAHSTPTSQIGSSFINKSFDFEEANSTITNKFKTPFIAIPKKNSAFGEFNGKKMSQITRKRSYFFKTFILALICFCAYLKFFCPYCKPGNNNNFICIPIPPHTRLVEDRLIVDDGYRLVKNVIDFCVPDKHSEMQILKRVNEYIKLLEYLRGDFTYGFAKSPRIRSSLISDPKVLNGLEKSGKVVISNGLIEAKAIRVTLRSFVKFYFYFLIKISLVLLGLSIFLKIYSNKRRTRNQLKSVASAIAKEVLDILNRQIMMSVKSSQFKPNISSEQMRDALEIKDDVWKYVDEIISKNSNVEKSKDLNGQTTWKWIGPVLYKNSEAVDFQ